MFQQEGYDLMAAAFEVYTEECLESQWATSSTSGTKATFRCRPREDRKVGTLIKSGTLINSDPH